MADEKLIKAMEKEEAKEHVKFSKKQIHQIVLDHLKAHPMADNKHFKTITDKVAALEAGEDESKEESSKERVERMTAEHKAKHG